MGKCLIQIGEKKCGKTFFCKQILTSQEKPKRALVMDVDCEYKEFIKLNQKELESFLKNTELSGIYRVSFNDLSLCESKKLYKKILSTFKNGTLICENITEIFKSLPSELFKIIKLPHTFKICGIINFNDWKQALHPSIIQNVSYINLYKTVTSVEFNVKLIPGYYYDLFLKAEQNLINQRNILVDLDKMQLIN